MYMRKNILVTGAAGFIGRNLVERLIVKKYRVTAFVRDEAAARQLFGARVSYREGDVADGKFMMNLPRDFSQIVHAAAAVSYRRPEKEEFYRVNVEGTENILAVAEKQKHLEKFIYLSSVGVYGPVIHPPADETTPHTPVNDYEISKDKAEQLVIKQFKKIPSVIIQPTLVYGPGDTASGMHGLFQAVRKGLFINIWGNKTQLHPCYIDNVIDALLLSIHSPIQSQTFIIADPKPYTLPDLVRMIKEAGGNRVPTPAIPLSCMKALGYVGDAVRRFGLPSPISNETVRFMTEHRAYDIGKAQSLLNYTPVSTEFGILRTLAHLRHGT